MHFNGELLPENKRPGAVRKDRRKCGACASLGGGGGGGHPLIYIDYSPTAFKNFFPKYCSNLAASKL